MRSSERGNAVIFILLAVALFAGLAYTFMRGAKSGQGNLTAGQAKLAAQDIINYSLTLERGVDKLMQRGCSQDELSFENAQKTGFYWENSTAPADKSCHIYDAAGAGLTDGEFNTGTGTKNRWTFSVHVRTDDFYGLTAYLQDLSDEVCNAINRQLDQGWDVIPDYPVGGCCNMAYSPDNGFVFDADGAHWMDCPSLTEATKPANYFCPSRRSGCYKLNGVNSYYRFIYDVPTS